MFICVQQRVCVCVDLQGKVQRHLQCLVKY